MAAILITKQLRKESSSIIMFSLAIAHLSISGIVNTLALISFFVGPHFIKNSGMCASMALVCFMAGSSSFFHIYLLALERCLILKLVFFSYHFKNSLPTRYVYANNFLLYEKVFTRKNTILYCVIAWLIIFSVEPPMIFIRDLKIFLRFLNDLFKIFSI